MEPALKLAENFLAMVIFVVRVRHTHQIPVKFIVVSYHCHGENLEAVLDRSDAAAQLCLKILLEDLVLIFVAVF
jgi:hypothetical protein